MMDEADLRKKTETNVFAEYLRIVVPTGQASTFAPPPPPTPQNMRRGIQTAVTSASVTANPSPPIKEYTYENAKQERVEKVDDDDEDDYNEDDKFVEDEARHYGRENVGPVASPYLMPYVYKRRFLDTQCGVRKDGNVYDRRFPRIGRYQW